MRIARSELETFSQPGTERTISVSATLGGLNAGEAGRPTQPVTGHLLARLVKGGIQLSGSIESVLIIMCDRCAQPFDLPVTGEVDVLLSNKFDASDYAGDSALLELESGNNWIDLSDPLREALLLELPQKRLCRSECNGLCSRCGTNLNIDSCSCEALAHDDRWAPLLAIKGKLEQA